MKAKTLLKKYNEEWTTIEAQTWDDVMAFKTMLTPTERRRIAYNAAFNCCYLIHKLWGKNKK